MNRPSKVPALQRIDALARRMAQQWMHDRAVAERVGEQEFAFRKFRAAARKGREIERSERRRRPSVEEWKRARGISP